MSLEAFYSSDFKKLQESEINHLKVKRYKVGDRLFLINGLGEKKEVKLESVDPVSFEIISSVKTESKNWHISVGYSLLKGSADDSAIENMVMLGVDSIIPISSERSIAKWDQNKFNKSLSKLNKQILEASKTARRAKFPDVIVNNEQLYQTRNIINLFKEYDFVCALHENASNKLVNEIDKLNPDVNLRILLLFGPEGGFTNSEIELFNKNDAKICLLGENILKAPLAISSALSLFVFKN